LAYQAIASLGVIRTNAVSRLGVDAVAEPG
jgi:hypothetical protein